MVGALSDDARLMSEVCLSVAYIGPKSRTERPRKTKIGTEVVHVTRDSVTTFNCQKVKSQLAGAGAHCGGLTHSLLKTTNTDHQRKSRPVRRSKDSVTGRRTRSNRSLWHRASGSLVSDRPASPLTTN